MSPPLISSSPSSGQLKLGLAQVNPIVGDIQGNANEVLRLHQEGASQGVDLIFFPELFLSGYPPEDLILKSSFLTACREHLLHLAHLTETSGPSLLVGVPWEESGHIYNAVALLDQGKIQTLQFKYDLPNYGVFDEKRLFTAGPLPTPLSFRSLSLGLLICEDVWTPEVSLHLKQKGAEMLCVLNASPYWRGKNEERLAMAQARVQETNLPLLYLNMVGGQDELVFDGGSFILKTDLSLETQLKVFEEQFAVTSWQKTNQGWICQKAPPFFPFPSQIEADYRACVKGLQDYVHKSQFSEVLLGLSGGIDSALCATMAVDALGPDHVQVFMLPYHYTSPESLEDAEACARALGLRYQSLPIDSAVQGLELSLAPIFKNYPRDVTEENMQSRLRGTLLMALSNKLNALLLTTGNKSELSVGYATLYGDMNGGFNPLKDLYKTEVFRLMHWRMHHTYPEALGPSPLLVPQRLLTKAPTAELRENQKDEDSLPPYSILDPILEGLIERDCDLHTLIAEGYDESYVRQIQTLLYRAEYKRRQAAPGVKITTKNLSRDRRYPLVNYFRT